MKKVLFVLGVIGLLAVSIHAQTVPLPQVSISMGGGKGAAGGGDVSTALELMAMLTILSLAPALLMLTTAFTRIVIILSFVRSALGTPTIPPNQVVIGLSLFLTFFIMGPTYTQVNKVALQPLIHHKITTEQAIDAGSKPVKEFMLRNTYEKDLNLFMGIRHEHAKTAADVDIVTLIPAFITSELKTAFIIGFYVFVPFMIIDLIVASILMSMGMMMLPPTIVSLPAKILVFVLANGWGTLIAAIVAGYR